MLVVGRPSLAPLAARSLVGRTEPRLVAVMINRRAWEDVHGVLMMAEVAEVDDGLAVARRDDIGFDVHQLQRLSTRLFRLRNVYSHESDAIVCDERK